jgi:hypothetical protein
MGLWARTKSLTAAMFRGRPSGLAAGRLSLGSYALESATTEWQAEAAELYNIVPELRYGIYWIASSSSRSKLVVSRVPTGTETEPEQLDHDHPAWEPLNELAPTEPEQSTMLYRIVTLMKLLGRWRLVGFDTDSGTRQWIVASEYDYRESGSGVWVHDSGTGTDYEIPHDAVWSIPMLIPHPVRSSEPDAPTRALIPTLHELIDLSGHVQTAAKSRIAGAGLLLIPNSLNIVAPGQSTGVNPPEGNPAMQALIRTSQASLRSATDVSRHMPVILEGHQEALNAVRHLSLQTPFDERVDGLRTSAVRRIAIGLDLPAEVLTGMGDLNHWTAWQVESSGQRVNVEPTLTAVCRELTVKFLRPALEAMGLPDADKYMVDFDDAGVQNEANKGDLALSAYELGIISADAARTALGYSPSDAPPAGQVAPRDARDEGGAMNTPALNRPLVPSGIDRLRDRLRDTTNRRGPASGEDSQIGLAALASDGGWAACADLAARRALNRCGQYLLGSDRGLRGKHKELPLDQIHTKVAAEPAVVASALAGAFTELHHAAPLLVEPVANYVRFRIETGTKHDKSEMCEFLLEEARR